MAAVDSPKDLAALLTKAQGGDHSSLQTLCKELEGYVRRFFQKKFRADAVVDDLCQETFIRFLHNLPQIRDKMKLRSFVAKVAFHVMQDHFRQKYRKSEERLEEDYQDETIQEPHLKVENLENESADDILNKVDLTEALNKLSEKSREIILLKSQGYDYEEISEQMGLSISGVKMQVKRTLEQLRFSLLAVTFLSFLTTILREDIS